MNVIIIFLSLIALTVLSQVNNCWWIKHQCVHVPLNLIIIVLIPFLAVLTVKAFQSTCF